MGMAKKVDCVQAIYKIKNDEEEEIENCKDLKTNDKLKLEVLAKSAEDEEEPEKDKETTEPTTTTTSLSKPVGGLNKLKSAKINMQKATLKPSVPAQKIP